MASVRTIDHIARDEARLQGVHPELRHAVLAMLDAMDILGFPMFVTQGVRTVKEQQALYAKGRTAPGPVVTNADGVRVLSNHQVKSDGYGHAVDFAFLDDPDTPKSEVYDPSMPWDLLGLMAEKKGLRWGGRWTFVDLPHVERP